MARLLLVGALYIVVLQAILSYMVPSARAAGLSAFWAGFTFFAVNVTAMVARLVWGKVADRQGGSRRVRTLVETGVVGVDRRARVRARAARRGGARPAGGGPVRLRRARLERAPLRDRGRAHLADLAGRSVAVAATVVFLISAVCTPLLGALADDAGWDVFWVTAAGLSALGALAAAGLRRLPHRAADIGCRNDPPRSRGFAATQLEPPETRDEEEGGTRGKPALPPW